MTADSQRRIEQYRKAFMTKTIEVTHTTGQ
jgi:hypothetical protein